MAHAVTFTVPQRELGKVDIEFEVKKDGEKFGTLKVSKGAIVWTPVNKQYGYKLGWTRLDELAVECGRGGHK